MDPCTGPVRLGWLYSIAVVVLFCQSKTLGSMYGPCKVWLFLFSCLRASQCACWLGWLTCAAPLACPDGTAWPLGCCTSMCHCLEAHVVVARALALDCRPCHSGGTVQSASSCLHALPCSGGGQGAGPGVHARCQGPGARLLCVCFCGTPGGARGCSCVCFARAHSAAAQAGCTVFLPST